MKAAKNAFFPIIVVVAAFSCAWVILQDHGSEPKSAAEQTSAASTESVQNDFSDAESPANHNSGRSGQKILVSTKKNRVSSRQNAPTAKKISRSAKSEYSAPSKSDLEKLDIPNICTAELPGLDFGAHEEALINIRDAIRNRPPSGNPPSNSVTPNPLAKESPATENHSPARVPPFESLENALTAPTANSPKAIRTSPACWMTIWSAVPAVSRSRAFLAF